MTLKTVTEWEIAYPKTAEIFNDITFLSVENFPPAELYNYFVDKYGNRKFARPFATADTTTDPDTINEKTLDRIRAYIKRWYNSHTYKYTKMLDTLNFEYDPIENYSMTETGTDTRSPNITTTDTTAGNTTSTTTNSGDITNIGQLTTFDNVSDFNNADKQTTTDNTQTNNTNELNNTNTRKETGNESTQHTLTRKGNIGLTTTQHMIQAKREVAVFYVVEIFLEDIARIILLGVY